MQERKAATIRGPLMFVVNLVLLAGAAYLIAIGTKNVPSGGKPEAVPVVVGAIVLLFGLWCMAGFFLVFPNEAKVLTLAGRYYGTENKTGWHWTVPIPIVLRTKISQRIQNF